MRACWCGRGEEVGCSTSITDIGRLTRSLKSLAYYINDPVPNQGALDPLSNNKFSVGVAVGMPNHVKFLYSVHV